VQSSPSSHTPLPQHAPPIVQVGDDVGDVVGDFVGAGTGATVGDPVGGLLGVAGAPVGG
jgi:hypothetical protein